MKYNHPDVPQPEREELSPEERAHIARIFRRRAVILPGAGPGLRHLCPDGPRFHAGGARALRGPAPAGEDAGGRVFDLRVLSRLRAAAPQVGLGVDARPVAVLPLPGVRIHPAAGREAGRRAGDVNKRFAVEGCL